MIPILFKEILSVLYSPRFIILATVCIAVSSSAFVVGYLNYEKEQALYEMSRNYFEQRTASSSQPQHARVYVNRQPAKLLILNAGTSQFSGRKGMARTGDFDAFTDSPAADDPVLTLFGPFDVTFVFCYLFSLLSLLLTHDVFTGEKDSGTLKMIQAYPVGRQRHALASIAGRALVMLMVSTLSFLTGLTIIHLLWPVAFSAGEWGQILLIFTYFILLQLVFVLLASAISSITKTRQSSLLLSLFTWIIVLFVIPSTATTLASTLSPPMLRQEFEDRLGAIRSDDAFRLDKRLGEYLEDNPTTNEMWEEDDPMSLVQSQVDSEILDRTIALWNEYCNLQERTHQLYRKYSALSPVASVRTAINTISTNGQAYDLQLNRRMLEYAIDINRFLWDRQLSSKEERQPGALSFSSTEDGIYTASINNDYSPPKADLSGLPRFSAPVPAVDELLKAASGEAVALLVAAVLLLSLTLVAFNRYDVR
jgi:ABC-type transport system involved in multi-copper enzyme maturation permease subunit